MSDFVQFDATTPVVVPEVPAVPAKTYDKFWLTELSYSSSDPLKPIRLIVSWVPARDIQVPTGDVVGGEPVMITVKELMPRAKSKIMVIDDLFSIASQSEAVGGVINGLLTALKEIGVAKGIL